MAHRLGIDRGDGGKVIARGGADGDGGRHRPCLRRFSPRRDPHLSGNDKAPALAGAFRSQATGRAYSRLPNRLSNIVNMLMKFR